MEKQLFVLLLLMWVTIVYSVPVPSFNEQIDENNNNPFGVSGKVIDFNNLDPDDELKFREMNINVTALREQQLALKNRIRQQNSDIASDEGFRRPLTNTYDRQSVLNRNENQNLSVRQNFENMRLEQIRHTLEASLLRNTTNSHPPQLSTGDVNHYTAAHPQCTPPRSINATAFFNSGNTWNLYFSPPLSQNPHNAILRLYKLNEEDANHNVSGCSQPEDLIRITVSYYVKRRDKRKRLCSSLMISRFYEGWVELDVKAAIKFWNKVQSNTALRKNYGIAIDVQDQDENPLRASAMFHNYNCEADRPKPWNFYKKQSPSTLDTTVPRIPRIDIQQRTSMPIQFVSYGYQSDSPFQMGNPATTTSQSSEEEQHQSNSHNLHHHNHRHRHLRNQQNHHHNHHHQQQQQQQQKHHHDTQEQTNQRSSDDSYHLNHNTS